MNMHGNVLMQPMYNDIHDEISIKNIGTEHLISLDLSFPVCKKHET